MATQLTENQIRENVIKAFTEWNGNTPEELGINYINIYITHAQVGYYSCKFTATGKVKNNSWRRC